MSLALGQFQPDRTALGINHRMNLGDHPRTAAIGDGPVELPCNPHARERRVGHQRQGFARAIVEDRQMRKPRPSVGASFTISRIAPSG
jgi:hypothetical protein